MTWPLIQASPDPSLGLAANQQRLHAAQSQKHTLTAQRMAERTQERKKGEGHARANIKHIRHSVVGSKSAMARSV